MVKKSAITLSIALVLTSASFATTADASATVKNGVTCTKSGATSIVTVKGAKKAYVCTVNPAAASNPNIAKGGKTWTLKTCVSYYAAYKSNQQSIDDQRSLVGVMSEPDKTNYTKQLDASEASLMQVLAAIENNHCKTGL
jgi:poly(3-hydroxybutyrate) depolymerase